MPEYLSVERMNQAEDVAFKAAAEVSQTLRENFGKATHYEKSSASDWVTDWDGWAEEIIVDRLRTFDSDIGFVGEELGSHGNQDVYWTVDPIDGTSGFVRGHETCTTMISLIDKDYPVVSLIYDFMREASYSAIFRQGAYKNFTQPLKVSPRQIAGGRIETYVPDDEEGRSINSSIRKAGAFVTQIGSAGYTFVSIARGADEGFVSKNNPYATIWDYAPGALLVSEAGGIVQNLDAFGYSVENSDLIASNKVVFGALKNIAENK